MSLKSVGFRLLFIRHSLMWGMWGSWGKRQRRHTSDTCREENKEQTQTSKKSVIHLKPLEQQRQTEQLPTPSHLKSIINTDFSALFTNRLLAEMLQNNYWVIFIKTVMGWETTDEFKLFMEQKSQKIYWCQILHCEMFWFHLFTKRISNGFHYFILNSWLAEKRNNEHVILCSI